MQKYQSPACWLVSLPILQQVLSTSFSDNGNGGGGVGHEDAGNGGGFGDARQLEPSFGFNWGEEE